MATTVTLQQTSVDDVGNKESTTTTAEKETKKKTE